MSDRKARLALALLAVVLPGPWTPLIVLAYVLAHRRDDATTAADPREPTRGRLDQP